MNLQLVRQAADSHRCLGGDQHRNRRGAERDPEIQDWARPIQGAGIDCCIDTETQETTQ
jgi:hypothetical protein